MVTGSRVPHEIAPIPEFSEALTSLDASQCHSACQKANAKPSMSLLLTTSTVDTSFSTALSGTMYRTQPRPQIV